MASSSPAPSEPAPHPQRQKMIVRTSCRKVKELSAKLAAGEVPDVKYLRDSRAALQVVYEACTGADHMETETNVEVILGPLLSFLAQLKGSLQDTMTKSREQLAAAQEGDEEWEKILAITAKWHQTLQRQRDEAIQTRQAWEAKNPVQAAQEEELLLYTQDLLPLLDAPSARAISTTKWQKAETSLESLQVYLLENKISAKQIASGGKKGIAPVLRELVEQLEIWDAQGLGFRTDERVDLGLVEKIWGRADKIGSGLSYLLTLDARGDSVDGVEHTTRSVFLLKSAPPVHFKFSPSKDAWLVKRMSQSRKRLMEVVLSPDEADVKRDDEPRWSAAYRELESLESIVKLETRPISQKTVRESRIEEVLLLLHAKLKSLHVPLKGDEDESAYALMYITWELTMRITAALAAAPDT